MNTPEQKKRVTWIDVAKGITIILMVVGHSSMPDFVHYWIFAFHMPLFFILSGMTTNWDRDNFMRFVSRKAVGLLRPFIIYSIICLVIVRVLNLADLSWSRGWGEFALWFVPVLFVSLIVSKFAFKLQYVMGGKWLIYILLPMIGGTMRYFDIILPWNMSAVPLASFFILTGVYSRKYISVYECSKLLCVVMTFIVPMAISHFWHLDMAHNLCLPLMPIIIAAFSGTLFISQISHIIDKISTHVSKILQSVGKETFIILAFSQIFIMTLNKYCVMNSAVKYAFLLVAMICIKYFKDLVISIYSRATSK